MRNFFFSFLALLSLNAAFGGEISLTDRQAAEVGRQIWQNESGGTVDGLTAWNTGEDFASLGIGHFIWYPRGKEGPFDESFPKLVAYLEKNGVSLPRFLNETPDCPWQTKTQFDRDFRSDRMNALRKFLAGTVPEQTKFIIARLESALPKMLAAAPAGERDVVRKRFYAVASTPRGVYALLDYVNFKGEGTSPTERYKGQGWGLLQVLENMEGDPGGSNATREFSRSAKKVLARRVQNSPPARNEARWLPGWKNRTDTYLP